MKYLTKDNEDHSAETNVVCFKIPIEPIPLKRPRFFDGKVYDPQKQDKKVIGFILQRQAYFYKVGFEEFKVDFPLVGNLSMDIKFYFGISRAVSHKKKELLRGALRGSRPDLSNCIKFYEDVMQDVGVYKDDAQIVEIHSQKLYDDGNGPRVEIIIRSIN